MLKTLKFSGEETNFFFVSDLHIHHDRDFIYTKRANPLTGEKYKTVIEHDKGIIEGWNSVCNNKSIIFNCGDVIFKDSDGSGFMGLMRQLDFKEHYVLFGNHTSGQRQTYIKELLCQFPNSMDGYGLFYEVYPLRLNIDGNPEKTVIFLPEYAEIQINSTLITLCHYPIISHNKLGHGSYMICGHSHASCQITNKDSGTGFRLDVGIESFGRPLSLKEVKYHLRNRTTDSFDHHNEKTT